MKTKTDPNKKWVLTPTEAAEYLGVSVQTMRELAHQKGFPMFTNGRKILIPKEAFHEWVESQVWK